MQNFISQLGIGESFAELTGILGVVFKYTWPVLIIFVLAMIYLIWWFNQKAKFGASIKYVNLAVSIPEESELNPKSMEQVFAGIHGIDSGPNFVEKYFLGESQLEISLEIVGIQGQIRYIFRTPEKLREAVEAHIYAQYPEAEIIEVDDYVTYAPDNFPSDEYDMFGAEIRLMKPDAYPIRTYLKFADDIDKGNFIDPIANITESLSRLGIGEQIWIQLVMRPTSSDSWIKDGEKLVEEMMGRPAKEKSDWFKKKVIKGVHSVQQSIEGGVGIEGAEVQEEDEAMSFLSPGEREVLSAVEMNISKIAYEVKFRFMYLAKKDAFDKAKGVVPFYGALRLFNTKNLNGFYFDKKTKTKVDYFKYRIPKRQRKFMSNYKNRSLDSGSPYMVLNIEELATIFHFPYINVKTPSVQYTETKKGEPPADLPLS